MKRKPDFDEEFAPKGEVWTSPVRSISRFMIAVVLCGAAFSVMAGMGKHKRTVRQYPVRVRRPVQVPRTNALAPQVRDPFVVVAAAEIDAEMVVPAPAGIDQAMVFNPYAGERQSAQGVPDTGTSLMPLPGTQPGQLPEYHYFAPRQPR